MSPRYFHPFSYIYCLYIVPSYFIKYILFVLGFKGNVVTNSYTLVSNVQVIIPSSISIPLPAFNEVSLSYFVSNASLMARLVTGFNVLPSKTLSIVIL